MFFTLVHIGRLKVINGLNFLIIHWVYVRSEKLSKVLVRLLKLIGSNFDFLFLVVTFILIVPVGVALYV